MDQNSDTKICPFCAEEVKTEAIKCRYCGSDFSTDVTPDSPTRGGTLEQHMQMVSLSPGSLVSHKYQIVRMIGKGGMGCVYEAREVDFDVDRSVAIKILIPNFIQDEKNLRRFEHEIKIAAKLDHPNIVPIYNIGREKGMLYFVMKYLSGPTLKDKIREQGVLPEKEARHISLRIADALGYMHDQGCIHRDIKANNIMLDATGHPILMDFGISKMSGGDMMTTEGEILGTATYMAPEQWNGEHDKRCDIYSFGCVLYEMVTGRPPFQSDSIPELMQMHLSHCVPSIQDFRSDLSPKLVEVIYRCLAKDPNDRFQKMDELKQEIESLTTTIQRPETPLEATTPMSGEDIKSEPVPVKIGKEKRGIKLPLIIGGSALLIVLLFLFVFLPMLAPRAVSSGYIGAGDTLQSIGWYRYPPLLNTFSCYQRASGISNSPKQKARINKRWVVMYQDTLKTARQYRSKGKLRRSLSYYRVAYDISRMIKLNPWGTYNELKQAKQQMKKD